MSLKIANSIKFSHPNFKSNEKEQEIKKDFNNKQEDKNNNKLTLALSALGLIAASTIATVYAYKRGNTKGLEKGLAEGYTNGFNKGKEEGLMKGFLQGSEKSELELLKKLKVIDLKTFKEHCKFKNGKAMINDTTPYTGKILARKKYGENVEMIYKDGVLEQALIISKEGVTSKYYHHDIYINYANGFKTRIDHNLDGSITKNDYWPEINGRSKEVIKHIKDGKLTGRVIERFNLSHPNHKNGFAYPMEKVTDVNTGKVIRFRKTSTESPSILQYKKHVIKDGKKMTEYYEDKELIGVTINSFNPETKVTKYTHHDVDPINGICDPHKEVQTYIKDGNKLFLVRRFNPDGSTQRIAISDAKRNLLFSSESDKHFLDSNKRIENTQKFITENGLKFEL